MTAKEGEVKANYEDLIKNYKAIVPPIPSQIIMSEGFFNLLTEVAEKGTSSSPLFGMKVIVNKYLPEHIVLFMNQENEIVGYLNTKTGQFLGTEEIKKILAKK